MSVTLGIPQVRGNRNLAVRAAGAPDSGPLVDSFGRQGTDLRVSLTDTCNLRCTYCMPASGMTFLPRSAVLTANEAVRIVNIAVAMLGVRELRLTGGEPLLRQDLEDIIGRVRARWPELPIALTTNAIGLERRLDGLLAAGLDRVNISLDTVDAATFKKLSRRNSFAAVMRGVDAACEAMAGGAPGGERGPGAARVGAGAGAAFGVKFNAVLMRGVNDHQAADLVEFALARGVTVRFIEQMPLDADHGWTRANMVSAADIASWLEQRWELRPVAGRGSAPAELFDVVARTGARAGEQAGARAGEVLGQVGIIASVTRPFCAACTRTRITAEGKVRSCLFSNEEFDLLGLIRDGATDDEVAQVWRQATWLKPKAHGMDAPGLDSASYQQPERTMSAIGG